MIPKTFEEYKKIFCPDCKYISPKERKANQVKWTYKYGDKEIKHLTSKQLGAMVRKIV